MCTPEDLVYFFTVGNANRPTYRRGILDSLCFPSGKVLKFRYRKSQIEKNLLLEFAGKSKRGVIVFVDVLPNPASHSDAADTVTYLPLRHVTAAFPSWTQIDGTTERQRLEITLTLGQFVRYSTPDPNTWHDAIQKIDYLRRIERGKPLYFVVKSADIFGNQQPDSARDERSMWEETVDAVAQSYQFQRSVFLWLSHPTSTNTGDVISPSKRVDDRLAYKLKAGKSYEFELSIREGEKTGAGAKIAIVSADPGIVQVDQPFQSAVSGVAEWKATILCKRRVEHGSTSLSFEVSGIEPDKVNAPNPVLTVEIPVPWPLLALGLISLFIGSLLLAQDKDSVFEFSLLFSLYGFRFPEFAAIFLKIAGAVLVAFAGYIGLRKFPTEFKT